VNSRYSFQGTGTSKLERLIHLEQTVEKPGISFEAGGIARGRLHIIIISSPTYSNGALYLERMENGMVIITAPITSRELVTFLAG